VDVWRAEALPVSIDIGEPVRWSQPSLEVDVLTGTIAVKSLSLYTAPEVDEVEYELMGNLGDLATVASGAVDESSEIREHRLSLHFVVPDDTPVGDYDGMLYAWAGDRTLSRPLAILLRVVEPTAGSIPEGIAAIMPDRIVTDGETGFRYVHGQAEITLTDDADISAFSERLQQIGGVYVGSVPDFPFYQIRFPDVAAAADLDDYIDQLRADPDVASAHREWLTQPRLVPNDPQYNSMPWDDTGFPQAWDLVYAVEDIDALRKIQIAIVDNGFWSHPDLMPNVDSGEPSDFLTPLPFWVSFYDERYFGHGTSVAGVLGAVANNYLGVAGGIWNTAIRLYDTLALTNFGQINSLREAVAEGAAIVNYSQGSPYKNQQNFENERIAWRRFFSEALFRPG